MRVMDRRLLAVALFALMAALGRAEAPPNAADLAAKLAAAVQDGDSVARAKFKFTPAGGAAPVQLQVQIKARRTKSAAAVSYQVLWPPERKGETVVLRQSPGGAIEGVAFTPPDTRRKLGRAQASDPLLGSDLALQDVVENFFLWPGQTLAGTEKIGAAECLILDSKPSSGDPTPYGRVRSWVDPRKMLPLRVEKYDRNGKLLRRIETTLTARDDLGRPVPASMTVAGPGGGTTEIDGSNIRHDVALKDTDFAAP
jgi:outer membrane lipoprotein-sorting protein